MRKQRVATPVIIAGGVGLLVGQTLTQVNAPWYWWGPDSVFGLFHLFLLLNLILLALAAWHFVRFGLGKLVTIGLLATGALVTWLFEGPNAGYSGVELVGLWLVVASAAVVLIGVFWSNAAERPDGYPGGRADHRLTLIAGGSVIALALVALMSQWFGSTESAQEGSTQADQGLAQDEWSPVQDEEWRIAIDGDRPGVHVVSMIKTFAAPDEDLLFEEADLHGLGGHLVWEESVIELCGVGIRSGGVGFVQIGDTFPTTEEGCGPKTEMQQVFDDFGMPETACLRCPVFERR